MSEPSQPMPPAPQYATQPEPAAASSQKTEPTTSLPVGSATMTASPSDNSAQASATADASAGSVVIAPPVDTAQSTPSEAAGAVPVASIPLSAAPITTGISATPVSIAAMPTPAASSVAPSIPIASQAPNAVNLMTAAAPSVASAAMCDQASVGTPSVPSLPSSDPIPMPPQLADAGMAGGEWRDKDADRSARQQIARIILTLIMKSANRPASVNYNPREIARRLEHTLYMSAGSREEYSNVHTLKARLQQALDNSRRRQMQLQQQQQATGGGAPVAPQVVATPAPAASAAANALHLSQQQLQQQLQAQQLQQQQQLQLLQRQQQQQLAAQLNSQRTTFQGVPFPGAAVAKQPAPIASQPLQMPLSMPPGVVGSSGISVASASAASASVSSSLGGSSILDELEREADEMANGFNDEPLAMPDSELQSGGALSSSFTSPPTVPTSAPFNAMPLSMPPEIGGALSMAPTSVTSVGFAAATATVPATGAGGLAAAAPNAAMYHGMNLTQPQLQQIQQLQQLHQLRRMQQLQQLQQQQQVANAAANIGLSATVPGAAATAAQLQATTGLNPAAGLGAGVVMGPGMTQPTSLTAGGVIPPPAAMAGGAPGMMQMSEAAIAQKREELKRRLIQLKHARTCTVAECPVDYCARTKGLLSHVSRCANANCTTIGCKSTRQLLSHFRKCRNLQCEVCSAIRPPMNETEQQLVLRRQQERLCMLRHASTCAVPQCVLPYCAGMRVLWKHICECHQRQCRTDHCISSRYVLSHFKQCNKMICEVCGPVRKAIKIVDSCKGNLPQLQIAASQVPDGVRNLIKIMNTMVGPNALAAGQAQANASAAGAAALQRAAGGAANPAWLAAQQGTSGVKVEGGQAGSDISGLNAATTAAGEKAGIKVELKDGATTPIGADALDSKKRPAKFQTEKEKKLRRKEQAKIAKMRVQAKQAAILAGNGSSPAGADSTVGVVGGAGTASTKSQAKSQAAAGRAAPIPTVQLNNGLVVRGSQAKLRADHFFNQQDISFLDSMTESQLDEHIRSLRFNFCGYITLTELKNRLMPLLTKLMDSEYGWVFNNPVDPVQWNIPDYFDVIKCPMDLGTIKKRLENEHYYSVETFASDVRLVFENCIAYNSSTNNFNVAAKQLLASFDRQLAALKSNLEKQLFKRCELRKEEMCQLCGGDSFKFAPCMLFCSGPCTGRIRRHTHYYSDPRGEHHWCSSCYKQMKDGPIDMALLPQLSGPPLEDGAADIVLTKSSLLKRKNSEVAEEPWVECDSCKLWYHQICALFNERNHAISGEQEPFVCPICVKKQRAKGVKPNLENGLKAKRLPITRMAKLIEERVLRAIATAHEEEATRMGNLGNADSIGFKPVGEEPKSDTQFGVTIREVLSVDKQVQIKPKMGAILASHYGKPKKTEANGSTTPEKSKSLKRQRVDTTKQKKKKKEVAVADDPATNGSTLQLTYRSRCICVFQELDGVDVLIFTLYVQEYGPDSLSPNAGRVYVSYLDSVNYFQPKKLRTLMHQNVMLGFLEDCRDRGFHTCHIWSCPPLKGDDYIFFCKPENQKIPKAARLRSWYQKILQEAKKEGLVTTISNLYAEYYMKKKAAHELPYFEGDYWPRLAEDLIKQLEEKGPGAREKTTATPAITAGDVAEAPSVSVSGDVEDTIGEQDDDDGDGGDDEDPAPTPAMSPEPNDENNGEETSVMATPAAPSSTGKSKKSAGKKSKMKRSSVAGGEGAAATRSSTTTRSKKGTLSAAKPSGSSKTVINTDPIMQKLKGILEPQKDDFFVVDLHPRCHKCASSIIKTAYWELKTMEPSGQVPELLEAVKKTRASSSSSRNAMPRHYHHYFCTDCYEINKTQLQHRVEVASNGAKRAREICDKIFPLVEATVATQVADVDMQEIKYELALVFVDPNEDKSIGDAEPAAEEQTEPVAAAAAAASGEQAPVKPEGVAEEATDASGTEGTVEMKTEPAADVSSTSPAKEPTAASTAVVKRTPSKSTALTKAKERDLDDLIMPCEIFDTREAFLMYCQNNHCQFDQLRRAKHSSMMVLYHLFNQGTTGFTFSCSGCKITLLSGNRWNCSICPVFNLCDDCNAKTKHEHQLHLFKIVPIPRPGMENSADEANTIAPVGGASGSGKRAQLKDGSAGRGTKRDANGVVVKRKAAVGDDAQGVKKNRKRKLNITSPVKATDAPATAAVTPTAVPTPVVVPAAAAAAAAAATPSGATEDPSQKKPRIHNIDPALLLQLEHASGCTIPECAFTNCQRMRSMLKHGAMCEQRLTGPCVLCKRIIGLLSAHARQCQKEYTECKVPRCADIRRHFLAQLQQRQEQLRQQQAAGGGTAAPTTTTGDGSAPAAASTTPSS